MTIKKKTTTYKCEYCKSEYTRLIDAKNCEERCSDKKHKEEIEKVLKTHHKDDTRYKKHCVDCGERLLEWEYVITPVETYPGECIYRDKKRQKDFDGLRCLECAKKIKKFLYDALIKYKKENDYV